MDLPGCRCLIDNAGALAAKKANNPVFAGSGPKRPPDDMPEKMVETLANNGSSSPSCIGRTGQ